MTDKKTEALKLALEALESLRGFHICSGISCDGVITAIREALAEQPAQQDSTCNKKLREQGKAYPRTCKKCGLGPCIADRVQPAYQQELASASVEPVAFEIRAFNATQALIKRADVAQEKADVLERGFGSEADVTIVPLYTSPPASKPLTDEQRNWVVATCPTPRHIIDTVEKMHGIKEKNT